MVLTFLIILAVLAYAILGELERNGEPLTTAGGDCPECATATESDWLLCPRCRTLLQERCPECGRQTAASHLFCPWCGRPHGEGDR